MDKDFGELVFRDHSVHSGIILLRLKGWPSEYRVNAIAELLTKYVSELENNFIVVMPYSVRVIKS